MSHPRSWILPRRSAAPRGTGRLAAALGIFAVVATLLTACGGVPGTGASTSSATPEAVGTAGWLARGGCRAVSAPAPSASRDGAAAGVVLSVTGRLGPDRTTPVQLTLADLDALPQTVCRVDDDQALGRTVSFRGVLLATLLADIGAEPSSTLHTSALNDYTVDVPVSDIRTLPVLLATRADEAPMSVARYGPLRLVYPTTGFDLDPTVYDPRWIWQLRAVEVG